MKSTRFTKAIDQLKIALEDNGLMEDVQKVPFEVEFARSIPEPISQVQ